MGRGQKVKQNWKLETGNCTFSFNPRSNNDNNRRKIQNIEAKVLQKSLVFILILVLLPTLTNSQRDQRPTFWLKWLKFYNPQVFLSILYLLQCTLCEMHNDDRRRGKEGARKTERSFHPRGAVEVQKIYNVHRRIVNRTTM